MSRRRSIVRPFVPSEIAVLWLSDPAEPGEVVVGQHQGPHSCGFGADSLGHRWAEEQVAELRARGIVARVRRIERRLKYRTGGPFSDWIPALFLVVAPREQVEALAV